MCETLVLGWQGKIFWELAEVYLKSICRSLDSSPRDKMILMWNAPPSSKSDTLDRNKGKIDAL